MPELDLEDLLPVFFEGLRETREPLVFLADRGVDDLIT